MEDDSFEEIDDTMKEILSKHPYLTKSTQHTIPVTEEEVKIQVSELEDDIFKKIFAVKLGNEKLQEIKKEVEREQNRYKILSKSSENMSESEEELRSTIMEIRRNRKNTAMDAQQKRIMAKEDRIIIDKLLGFRAHVEEVPQAISDTNNALDIGRESVSVMDELQNIRMNAIKAKEPEKPKEEGKSAATGKKKIRRAEEGE